MDRVPSKHLFRKLSSGSNWSRIRFQSFQFLLYVLVCLFNNSVHSWGCFIDDCRVMNLQECRRKGSWCNLRNCPGICMQGESRSTIKAAIMSALEARIETGISQIKSRSETFALSTLFWVHLIFRHLSLHLFRMIHGLHFRFVELSQ
jgi:hypothetical protein